MAAVACPLDRFCVRLARMLKTPWNRGMGRHATRFISHMNEPDADNVEMREEYDFSQGVRGRHFRAYRAGHDVRIRKPDGTVEEHHFTLRDGAVMLDPDIKMRFPDSESVNRALRSLVADK